MKKVLPTIAIKSFGLTLKDFDAGSRKVKGYLSSFGVEDSEKDIIHPGAFAKSISERGPQTNSIRKIAFLRQHDWGQQIGKFLELREDDFGLMFVAQLGRSDLGERALLDYQDGILREHSIGFKYVQGKIEYDEEKNVYDITEVNLFEGSAVTFGANSLTPVVDVAKGLDRKKEIAKLTDEIGLVAKALRNGKGTDERLYSLEMRLLTANQKLLDLSESLEPGLENPTLGEKKEEKGQFAHKFYLNLIQNGI